jgi:hypothetical protein
MSCVARLFVDFYIGGPFTAQTHAHANTHANTHQSTHGEVVEDVLAPVGEKWSLRAIATETREEHLVGSRSGDSRELIPPTESVSTKHVGDREVTATGSDGTAGQLPAPGESDAQDVAKTTHLEGS